MQSQSSRSDVRGPFLSALCRQRAQVTVYLVNGVRIVGEIDSFDDISIVLRSQHAEQYEAPDAAGSSRKRMIFNHVISTVLPHADDEARAPEH